MKADIYGRWTALEDWKCSATITVKGEGYKLTYDCDEGRRCWLLDKSMMSFMEAAGPVLGEALLDYMVTRL